MNLVPAALDELGWSPTRPCLFPLFFDTTTTTSASRQAGRKRSPKQCRAGGVHAQLTPAALKCALDALVAATDACRTSTIDAAAAADANVVQTTLDFMDIARCERHRKAVSHLDRVSFPAYRACFAKLQAIIAARRQLTTAEDINVAAPSSSSPSKPGLDLIRNQSSFTACSLTAVQNHLAELTAIEDLQGDSNHHHHQDPLPHLYRSVRGRQCPVAVQQLPPPLPPTPPPSSAQESGSNKPLPCYPAADLFDWAFNFSAACE